MKRIQLKKDTRRLHLEMTVAQINVLKKIKAAREKYTRLLVGSIVPTYHQTMVNKATIDDSIKKQI